MGRGHATHVDQRAAEVARRRVHLAFVKAGSKGRTLAELQDELGARLTPSELKNVIKHLARARVIASGGHEGHGFRWYLAELLILTE